MGEQFPSIKIVESNVFPEGWGPVSGVGKIVAKLVLAS